MRASSLSKWLEWIRVSIYILIISPAIISMIFWDWLTEWFPDSAFGKWLAGITTAALMLLGVELVIAKAGNPGFAHDLSEPTTNVFWCLCFVDLIVITWNITEGILDDNKNQERYSKPCYPGQCRA